ncbi:SARP family transcriptional regulator [Sphaerisporangium krabiense]|uniref:DNA-binding SARP family transcriptional activator n=1 Tax=Sphaerisporangium krabiense TaxID=763782 RepID=A0A7W8Z4L4_9ACTN|nr:BTAD domain-containing putative transcriptional regulator [Sphaerisporangium krabiense]MBB5627287.1 DNA-binding SARP family transcriptional activator [Sphaerisporangium krabiense]GII64578.1 SARP family transcriptional regulator [Sphaerisporangium krabiense]
MEKVTFGVLGPVVAERGGGVLGLKGPRHRAVLARLIVARRRVVPVSRLVDDLWDEPRPGAVGAVQTFVGALRRVLEPGRPPRTPARLLVTDGPGYALRAAPDDVDAWRFETGVDAAATLPPARALERLEQALDLWRGPAYAEFADEEWTLAERSRLGELRLQAVERLAEARLAVGLAAEAVRDLEAHLAGHPLRENAWRLLALALYRTGRQGDALAVLRRARTALADELGVDLGPELRRLQAGILAHDPRLEQPSSAVTGARLWAQTAEAYDRAVGAGARARLESTVSLLRNLAVTGGSGLQAAQEHRPATIGAAEEFGDPELTARVIGAYDVPTIWTRSDDPEQSRRIAATAEHVLAVLPDGAIDEEATVPGGDTRFPGDDVRPRGGDGEGVAAYAGVRARLLVTIAVETRGVRSPRGPEAAREGVEIARRLGDPALLAFALNGAYVQSCTRAGLAARRDAIGAELVALAARHGLATYRILGHLVRVQARAALGDLPGADEHAAAVDLLAERHERPLATVFTQWYRALRLAAQGRIAEAEPAYRAAAARLDGAGMPGVEGGLSALTHLSLLLANGTTPATEAAGSTGEDVPFARDAVPSATEVAGRLDPDADWGPYRPWAEPFLLLGEGRHAEARTVLRAMPEPPPDLLYEALCCLEAAVALELGDRPVLERVHARLLPAAGELAGAGSGLITLGPVDRWLARIATALTRLPS